MSLTQILHWLVHDFRPSETQGECRDPHPAELSHVGYTQCAHTSHVYQLPQFTTCSEPHLSTSFLNSDNHPSSLHNHSEAAILLTLTRTGRLLVTLIVACMCSFLNHLACAERYYLLLYYCITGNVFYFCALTPLFP